MNADILGNEAVASGINLFSAWAEAQIAYNGPPGLAVGVIYDQELVWAQGFGLADAEKQTAVTPQTIFRIASITKLFTATAIIQLRDQGQLQLDDPVLKYLPWFTIQNQYKDAPSITIRHLLTHTSGLPREANFPYWTDSQFPTLAQIQATISRQATAVPTETRWKYSNLALSLAGAVVTQVAGQPYEDYVRKHILAPLGMNSTFIDTIDPHHERLAVGYGRRLPGTLERPSMPFTDCQGITPAANMATTIEDLAKFASFHLGNGQVGETRLLRQSSLREMQRIHWLEPNWQAGWGLGFYMLREKDKTRIGHGGAVLGYRTLFMLFPEEKTGVITFTNADDGNPLLYSEKISQWLLPPLVKALSPKAKIKETAPEWQQYTGKYRDAWGDWQVLIHNGELIAIDPSLPEPLLTKATLAPVTQHTFRLQTKNGYLAPGELVVFEQDAQGQTTRVKTGENYKERIEQW